MDTTKTFIIDYDIKLPFEEDIWVIERVPQCAVDLSLLCKSVTNAGESDVLLHQIQRNLKGNRFEAI